ncbi:hypothetical protein PENANT_c008G01801 [Penicillium antarcticum]|uniref:EGF-like domain-containing protein n=1 Tax=Penicillium antarcticum TaxID=416450 RepID=A0A1V6QAB6_9EURO|nr:hypothetical protein PENANT_c008G01801 [Penicillium antarcticum]
MIIQKILPVAVIFLCLNIIQKTVSQFICTSGDIFRDEVATCTCRDFTTGGSCTNRCPVGPTNCAAALSGIFLADCMSDCTSVQNKDCDACGIWLHSLCVCQQNASFCAWENSQGESWVKLAGQNLATTNEPIHNILALQTHPSLAITGWDFGQQISDPSSQGLAINPVRTVTQDQIHMHICSINPAMRTFLTSKSTSALSTYSTLQPIQLTPQFKQPRGSDTMWCLASQTKNSPISGNAIYGAINSVLQMHGICNYYVGAAVVRDGNGYTWGCVTADSGDAEHRFLLNC